MEQKIMFTFQDPEPLRALVKEYFKMNQTKTFLSCMVDVLGPSRTLYVD